MSKLIVLFLCVPEYERCAEDDQLVPPDGGRGGEPLVLQRDAERHVGRVPVRLLRRLLLQERVQARQSGFPTGKARGGTKRIKTILKNKPQKWRACRRKKLIGTSMIVICTSLWLLPFCMVVPSTGMVHQYGCHK
jgi:hypothetical protein